MADDRTDITEWLRGKAKCGCSCSTRSAEAATAIDTLRAREQELVACLDHIRYLLPLAKGYIAAHPGIKSTADIVADAEAFLSKAEG